MSCQFFVSKTKIIKLIIFKVPYALNINTRLTGSVLYIITLTSSFAIYIGFPSISGSSYVCRDMLAKTSSIVSVEYITTFDNSIFVCTVCPCGGLIWGVAMKGGYFHEVKYKLYEKFVLRDGKNHVIFLVLYFLCLDIVPLTIKSIFCFICIF